MIRPFTCLTVLLAAGSGLYLYSEKHRTTLLDDRIRAVVTDTHRTEDRTSMLRAEWALLNQPDRLQALAAKFLPRLQPMAPTQFVQAADLDKHLPAVGAPPSVVLTPPPVVLAAQAVAAPAPVAPVVPVLAVAQAPKPAETKPVRIARAKHVAPHRTMVAMQRPVTLVHQVASFAPPAPILSGAWHAPSTPAFAGSALGMAHMAMAPPMASR